MRFLFACCLLARPILYPIAVADDSIQGYGFVDAKDARVAQNLLNLVHACEVQQEIGLNVDDEFSEVLQSIDGPWWRGRILPQAEQRRITREQEEKLVNAIKNKVDVSGLNRLRQIELQSQSWRGLARPEIAEHLQLTEEQIAKLDKAYEVTDRISQKAGDKSAKINSKLADEYKKAREAEKKTALSILSSIQQDKYRRLLGNLVDVGKFKRIYPIAPELVDSGEWVNPPLSLRENRGKVVLLHFYAFQCHNCVANFDIYRRWYRDWSSRGVQVVGIQTPETSAERDPEKVKQAAMKEKLEFPVLIDIRHENWKTWGNTMWPTVYVIDPAGYIRFWWQGELNWQGATGDKTIESTIEELLAEYKGTSR
jgi:peroxiredoxin